MGKTIVFAACDSAPADKAKADIICSGVNDELLFNRAIADLVTGGTIQLLDGNYYIDSFPGKDNSAIYFGFNDGKARVINFIGDTENKSYNSHFGVVLHVTETAFKSIDPDQEYRVFYGTPELPESPGAFFTYTHINNVNFENFYLYFFDASKPLIGLDCRNFGSTFIKLVGIYTEKYFECRFMHIKPQTPCKGTIGLYSCPGSNDEMARVGFEFLNIGGLHTGMYINRMDHLVMQACSTCRCVYGYVFDGTPKTMTMINCCDEGNRHLPRFLAPRHTHEKDGHITMIDFNIERFNADFIPDDPDGDDEACAIEVIPNSWHGSISYTLQGKAFGIKSFWKNGHGRNVRTINLNHDRISRPENPEYLTSYFDTRSNRMLIWNGSDWVDTLGNIVL